MFSFKSKLKWCRALISQWEGEFRWGLDLPRSELAPEEPHLILTSRFVAKGHFWCWIQLFLSWQHWSVVPRCLERVPSLLVPRAGEQARRGGEAGFPVLPAARPPRLRLRDLPGPAAGEEQNPQAAVSVLSRDSSAGGRTEHREGINPPHECWALELWGS